MSVPPCSEWAGEPCVMSARQGELSRLCRWVEVCLNATPREQLSPNFLEYFDAWCRGTVCLLIYRPGAER